MTNREVRIGMTVYHKFRQGQTGVVVESNKRTDDYSRSGRVETRHVVKWSDGTRFAELAVDLRKTPYEVQL